MANPLSTASVPLLSGGKDAKSLIVGVLSKEFPLTAKQVFNQIRKREPTASLTYQGVHKALGQLAEQAVVSKDEKGNYQLNVEWAKNVKRFGEDVESKYSGGALPHLSDIKPGESVSMTFDNMIGFPYWLLSEMYAYYRQNPGVWKEYTIHQWYHVWPLTMLNEKEFKVMDYVMSKGKHFAICHGNSYLDRALLPFWEKYNKKMRLGVPCANTAEVITLHDFTMQAFLTEPMKREMDAIFSKPADVNSPNFAALYKFYFYKKHKQTVVVTNNHELTGQIVKDTLKYFR